MIPRAILACVAVVTLTLQWAARGEDARPEAATQPVGLIQRLGSADFRFGGRPGGARFSRDGRTILIVAGSKGQVAAWDFATGKPAPSPAPETQCCGLPAESPDGRYVVYGWAMPDVHGLLACYEVGTGNRLYELSIPSGMLGPYAISPDSKYLVMTTSWLGRGGMGALHSTDHSLRIHEVATGKLVHQEHLGRRGTNRQVVGIGFSPDSRWLATCSNDTVLRIWDMQVLKMVRELASDCCGDLCFSPDGKWLLNSTEFGSQVIDVATWAPIEPKNLTIASPAAFSPDGALLVGGQPRQINQAPLGTIVVYDVARQRLARTIDAHRAGLRSVAFAPDGKVVLSTGDDQAAHLWDVATWQELRASAGHWGQVTGLSWSSDSRRLATSDDSGIIYVWDVATGKPIQRIHHVAAPVYSVSLAADGRTVVAVGAKGTFNSLGCLVWLMDVANGRVQKELPGYGDYAANWRAWLSQDGKRIIGSDGEKIVTRSLDKEDAPDESPGRYLPELGAVATAGDYATGSGGEISLRDEATGKALARYNGYKPAAVSADLRFWASTGDNISEFRLGEMATGTQLLYLKARVGAVAFSPDGKVVAIARDGGTIELRDTRTAKVIREYGDPHGPADHLAFSPDGKVLASGGAAGSVMLWKVP